MNGFEKLDPDKVKRGEVYKKELINLKHLEVSVLKLLSGAKIKHHKHTVDMEFYIGILCFVFNLCLKGGWHGLSNERKRTIYVLSVKMR